MTGTGARDTLVTFQRGTASQAPDGEELLSWGNLGQEWAAIFWGRGTERRAAAVTQGEQPATFVVPSNSMTRGVGLKDRILREGQPWNIVGTSPGRDEIEFTAVRSS